MKVKDLKEVLNNVSDDAQIIFVQDEEMVTFSFVNNVRKEEDESRMYLMDKDCLDNSYGELLTKE